MSGSKETAMQKMMAISALVLVVTASACMTPQAQHAAAPTGATPSIEQPQGTPPNQQSQGTSPTGQPKGQRFSNPADAAAALYDAVRRGDDSGLVMVLGPDAVEIVSWSDDARERQQQQSQFAQKYEQMHRLVKEPDDTVALYVGAENWPLPIPLVHDQGGWYFDTELGREEIRYRRIGRNEMEALEVCRTLVDAEREYRERLGHYTEKFVSDGDSRNGLYWSSSDNNAKSPIGPYLALAGVTSSQSSRSQPFHGYYYRILLRGSDGFAILAFPAEYRSSGVMTFLVNPDGTAYEKDSRSQTDPASTDVAPAQPDSSWKLVE
jgi:hypothetical protein